MKNQKHTPGPWVSLKGYTKGDFLVDASLSPKHSTPIAMITSALDTREANANLVAAAPEMLALIERLRDGVYGLDTNPELIRVLKKARGIE